MTALQTVPVGKRREHAHLNVCDPRFLQAVSLRKSPRYRQGQLATQANRAERSLRAERTQHSGDA